MLAGAPGDAQALQLMGVTRRLQGQLAEAEEYYRRSLAIDLAQPQVHHNLGNLLMARARPDEAIAEQREAIRLKPNYAEAHLGLALALSAKCDHLTAERSCRDALRLQPNYHAAKQALAIELNELGRPREAERVLRQALALGVRDPRHAAALEHNLAIALKQQDRFDEALLLFAAAQSKFPELPAADYNRANTLQQLGRLEEAAESYLRAIARDRSHVDALAGMALTAAQLNDFPGARMYGERAVSLDAHHGIAHIALAIADIEAGIFLAAERNLRSVLEDSRFAADHQVSFALGFAADAYDRQDRISDAVALHVASNERRRKIHLADFQTSRAAEEVANLASYFERSQKWAASPAPLPTSREAAGHVFLLGFMRSGTTLLQTVLATNPAVVHIDEIEFLTEPARAFLLSDAGLDRLAALGPDEAAQWRNAYWKTVHDSGLSVAGKIFVDKMPFNSIRLPLIARLFPAAKIVFAVRDPRDVVLSCFRRRFNMGPFSFEFLRLDDCARFYASVMTLAQSAREKLPLQIREHRYEDTIADFDSSIRAICDFTGISWSGAMRDFSTAAGAVDRRSASAAQVRRGLYRGGAGQWRRYREQLRPVLPILQPWVDRFGYPEN